MTNNYAWNRVWTFRGQRGHVVLQGVRFLVVSSLALVASWFVAVIVIPYLGYRMLPDFTRPRGPSLLAASRTRALNPTSTRATPGTAITAACA